MHTARRARRSKPILRSYPTTRRRRGHIFSTTATAARRQRRRRLATLLGIAMVTGAVAFGWLWMRPVRLSVSAAPADATIRLAGSSPATGTLTVPDVPPGSYRATIARTGFETETVTLRARRFRGVSRRVVLTPLPQRITIAASPASARIVIIRGGRTLAQHTGSLATTIPAGDVTVRISAQGRNTYTRRVVLDSPLALEVRLDPEGQLVHGLGLIECAGAPKGVALNPQGTEAWATILDGPPSIEVFEPRSGKRVGEVDIGKHGAVEVVFSRDGRFAYASQMETAKVFEIDTSTRKVTRQFDTESAWTKVVALSPDGATLFAANWSGDDVSEIDLRSGKLRRRIRVADTPRGLWASADGKTLWVASFGVGHLERVDLATGKVRTVFKGGGALRHLVADEKRGLLFASDMARDCVWVTNMRTGATRRFAKVGHKPNTIDLSPDGRILFVSDRGENNATSYYLPGPEWGSVLLLDARSATPLDGVVGGNQCTALDVSDDGRLLVFSDFLDDRLRVYEVPDHRVLAQGGGGRADTLATDVVK